ncbi:MAG: cob(I)yrinic acid a,c-diamide adenosyltransferase [Clostridia bacterium]
MSKGLTLVYTGNGKGKTTAALGLGFRAAGHDKKIAMIQFMKGQQRTGELNSVEKFDNFEIYQAGRESFVTDSTDPMDIELAQKGVLKAKELVNEVDILILDEINIAMEYGLVDIEDIREFIISKPEAVDLILTGRNFPQELSDYVDMISEVKEIKHHFNNGVMAKKGIEY